MKRKIIAIILTLSLMMVFVPFVGCGNSSNIEGVRFSSVAAGTHSWGHSLAIDTEGNLWEWRNVVYRGSGCASVRYSTGFSNILSGEDFRGGDISVGGNHSLAIDRDGNLFAWGNNAYGQVGDRTLRNRANPVRIIEGTQFSSVSAGLHFSLAIDRGGNIWTWGRNSNGQLGIGSGSGVVSRQTIPIRLAVPNVTFIAVSAGGTHSLALDSTGGLWGWGNNFNGQAGTGAEYLNYLMPSELLTSSRNRDDINAPQRIKEGTEFIDIGTGSTHSAALDSDGNVWAWGTNSGAQLGVQDYWAEPSCNWYPCRCEQEMECPIVCGCADNCCDEAGECGEECVIRCSCNPSNTRNVPDFTRNRYAPKRVRIAVGEEEVRIVSIGAGHQHTMAIDNNGNLWAWGQNGSGRLGNGQFETSAVPVMSAFAQGTIVNTFSAGYSHNLAIDNLGHLFMWGSNPGGTIGGGVSAPNITPYRLT
ncbi:MAG: hypothetical protein FWE22_01680 [Firmicutes bacterium]|nr:hypothetical protein [Bacillota bacterium]